MRLQDAFPFLGGRFHAPHLVLRGAADNIPNPGRHQGQGIHRFDIPAVCQSHNPGSLQAAEIVPDVVRPVRLRGLQGRLLLLFL